jgi:sugar (pentulose or hexulose) kinase
MVRCILESLALKYRRTLESLEELAGYRVDTLHIVGGGSQNRLLNQFTANATGRRVVTGPVEATAAGNALVQLIALGEIRGLAEGREVIRRSFEASSYEPSSAAAWNDAWNRFDRLAVRS